MRITPKSEDEVVKSGLLEKGNYPFEVRKASEKVSKKGNEMIEVVLCVWDTSGREHLIYDYLMESIDYKLRHFWYSIGLGKVYETGDLDVNMLAGKQGECKVYVKEDKTGQYLPKNAVADYLIDGKEESKSQTVRTPIKDDFEDDSIPF